MADPQVAFDPGGAPPDWTPGGEPPKIPTQAEVDAKQERLRQLDPNADAKLEIARSMQGLGLAPSFSYQATDAISESLYQKKMDPPKLRDKLRNTFIEIPRLQSRKDELAGLQYLGNSDPEVEKEIKNIDKDLSTKKGLGDIPDMFVGGLYQLGYAGYHAAGWLADDIAGTLTANGLGKINYAGAMQQEANKVFGSLVGGMYRSMIDRGFDPTVARVASGTLAVGNLALLAIPGGEAARPFEESVIQGVSRAGLKGALEEGLGPVARYLGMDAATARTAGAFGRQGLFAVGSSLWNNVIPEVSGWLSNELARTQVPLKSLGKLGEDIAKATGVQFLTAAAIPMAKEAIRTTLTNRVTEAMGQMADRVDTQSSRDAAIESMIQKPESSRVFQMFRDEPALKDLPPRKSRDTVFDGETPHSTDDVIRDAVARIGKPFTTMKAGLPGASADVRTMLGRLPGKIRGAVSPVLFSHDFNSEMVFGGKDSVAYRVAAAHTIRGEMEVRPRAVELSQEVTAWAKENGLNRPAKVAEYAMKEFEKDGYRLTRQEVLSAAMHFANEDNKASLLKGQYIDRAANPGATIEKPIPEETFQKFFSDPEIIGEKEKDLLKRASTSLDEAGKVRAANHYKLHGEELPLVDQYWRKLVYRGDVPSEKDLEVQQERARWMQVIPDESSSIERQDVTSPLHLRGFFQEYPEIMHDTALLEKMGPSLQQAGKVLWDNRVMEAIGRRYGKSMVRHLQDTTMLMAGRGRSPQALENLFNELYNLTVTTDLGLNVRTPVKQAFLGVRSAPYVGGVLGRPWRTALMDVVAHPKRTRELAEKLSMAYRRARSRGGTIELDRVLSDGANFGKGKILRQVLNVKGSLQKVGMSLTKAGSLFSFKMDTMAAFNATQMELETALKGGKFSDDFRAATGLREEEVPSILDDKDAMFRAAGKYADYIIGESHATSYIGQRAGLLQTPVGRIMGIFKSEPMKALEQWTRALMQAKRNPTPSNLRKAVRTTILYGIAEPLAFYGMDWAWSKLLGRKQKPNFAARVITALAGYWFGVGDFVSGVVNRIEYPNSKQTSAYTQIGGIAQDAALSMYTALSSPSKSKRTRAIGTLFDDGASIMLGELGVPYYFPRSVIRSIQQRAKSGG